MHQGQPIKEAVQMMNTNISMSDEKMIAIAKHAADLECQAIDKVSEQINASLPQVVRLIESREGKVLVTGGGTSSMIARRLAHLLSVSKTPSLFIHAMDALHGTMGAIEPHDILIAISKGGESDEVNNLCQLVKAQGTAIVGIGEHPTSTLATLSDVFVTLHTGEEGDPANAIAMGSTLVAALWGDALTRTLMILNGWTLEESIAIHPAGYVGKMAGQLLADDKTYVHALESEYRFKKGIDDH